ncbi:hypothetical protein FPOAC2_09262 [Fusarium poae]
MIFDNSCTFWVFCTTYQLQRRDAYVAPLLRHLLFSSAFPFNSKRPQQAAWPSLLHNLGQSTPPGLLRSYRNAPALFSVSFGLIVVNRYSMFLSSLLQSIHKDIFQS